LTKGELAVTDIVGDKPDDLLVAAASLEKLSEHPIAAAVVKKAEEKGLKFSEPKNFEALAGRGVKGDVGSRHYVVGTSRLIEEMKIEVPDELKKEAESLYDQGKTLAFVAVNSNIVGIIAVADQIKENAPKAVKRLRDMGLKVVMITGDNKRTVEAIAKQVGIDDYRAEVLPEDKVNVIKELQKEGLIVAMVGDGVNDAPALAASDVGIALGSGTDVAIETGGIILIKNNLEDVTRAIDLSKPTYSKIRQNPFWAFAYNTALIPVAAGVLITGGYR
jgi:Cu+-exporting ATPase